MDDFRGSEILTFLDKFNLGPVYQPVSYFYELAYKSVRTNPQIAIHHCEEALEEHQKFEVSSQSYHTDSDISKEALGRCHLLLACIYLNQEEELIKAREHFNQSEEAFRSRQWSHLRSLAYFGLAITLRKHKRPWDDARDACDEAEKRTKDESIPSNIPHKVIEDLREAIRKERSKIIAQGEAVRPQILPVFEIKDQSKIIGKLSLRPGKVTLLKATDFSEVGESKSRKYDEIETQGGNFVICLNGNFVPRDLLGKEVLIKKMDSIEEIVTKGKEVIFFIVEKNVKCVFVGRKTFHEVKPSTDTKLHHYYLQSMPNDDEKNDIIVLPFGSNREGIKQQYSNSLPLIYRQASEVVILGAYVKTL